MGVEGIEPSGPIDAGATILPASITVYTPKGEKRKWRSLESNQELLVGSMRVGPKGPEGKSGLLLHRFSVCCLTNLATPPSGRGANRTLSPVTDNRLAGDPGSPISGALPRCDDGWDSHPHSRG